MSQQNLFLVRVLIGVVVVIALAGLFGWYFYLRTNTLTIETNDALRGVGSTAPSFTGNVGSTYANVGESTGDAGNATGSTNTELPELWQISSSPAAGAIFITDKDGESVRFIERATGNVLSADTKTGKVSRLTNTLIPRIQQAYFAADGSVVLQHLDESDVVVTFVGTVIAPPPPATAMIATSTIGTLKGIYLDKGILSLSPNQKTRELFYLINDPKSGVIGIRNSWDGSKPKRVFQSGISGWNIDWLSDGRTVLTQKPAHDIPGYTYELTASGSLVPLLRNIKGLSSLARPDSSAILYSSSANKTLSLYMKEGDKAPVLLPIKTLAEKCVWAPGKDLVAYCAVPVKLGVGNFVDNWLQGRFYTVDTWWKINVASGEAEEVKTPQNTAQYSIDVRKPLINASGSHITFSSGSDASLWLLRITTEKSGQ